MPKCLCSNRNYDRDVYKAVSDAADSLVAEAHMLSIIRNGGWEQWLRNLLLVELEEATESWGFTEAREGDTTRVDLIFRCKRCSGVLFAVEVKTNFAVQAIAEVNRRISEAINQLNPFLAMKVPSYIVYSVTNLYSNITEGLVRAQHQSSPAYKRFRPDNIEPWQWQNAVDLPIPAPICRPVVERDQCNAEVRVWIAAVESVENEEGVRTLRFLDRESFRGQRWHRRDLLSAHLGHDFA